jgi:hypothetical protein
MDFQIQISDYCDTLSPLRFNVLDSHLATSGAG